RQRVVAQLRNVSEELAQAVADGLGMNLPEPLPKALARSPKAEIAKAPSLSLMARPGEEGIKTRRIALLVADGVDSDALLALHETLAEQGAVPRFVGIKLGTVQSASGEPIEAEISLETAPGVLWDACVIPDGEGAVSMLSENGHALEFIKDQYRHCKSILALGAGSTLLEKASIPASLESGEADPGLLLFGADDVDGAAEAFIAAVSRHRHYERETDPPRV
ncbi:MAG: DJ-1/PfpI family protein, partial [Betaproteobacteria bacterium]